MFHATDLCRELCLAGPASRWAAWVALEHVIGAGNLGVSDGSCEPATSSFLYHVGSMLTDQEFAEPSLLEIYQQVSSTPVHQLNAGCG